AFARLNVLPSRAEMIDEEFLAADTKALNRPGDANLTAVRAGDRDHLNERSTDGCSVQVHEVGDVPELAIDTEIDVPAELAKEDGKTGPRGGGAEDQVDVVDHEFVPGVSGLPPGNHASESIGERRA